MSEKQAAEIMPHIQEMLDKPGFYLTGGGDEGELMLVSNQGAVFSMKVDEKLDPTQFPPFGRLLGPIRVSTIDDLLLTLKGIQSAVAEEFNMEVTPITDDEIRPILRMAVHARRTLTMHLDATLTALTEALDALEGRNGPPDSLTDLAATARAAEEALRDLDQGTIREPGVPASFAARIIERLDEAVALLDAKSDGAAVDLPHLENALDEFREELRRRNPEKK
jgi:hypothetical protein